MAKKKVKKLAPVCPPEDHSKCLGSTMFVLGVLILLNSIYGWLTWGVFVGGVVALKGIFLVVHKKMCK